MINFSNSKIGNLEFNIIQGGMGVGISSRKLAGAVANCGGIGIIAGVELGSLKNYSGKKYIEANRKALQEEIRAARQISPKGILGVNIMYALTDYEGLIKIAAEEDINLIISGAGLARNLPDLVKNPEINLLPIVSSTKAARVMINSWEKYNKIPDAFVVEGPLAGGHLGFKLTELESKNPPKLKDIAIEIKQNYSNIPIIVAGGIYTGQDIKYYHDLGFGVQMATRFVTTLECDADDKFKQTYLNAKEEDIVIIQSPVGMPGRAIKNSFLEKVINKEKINFNCKYNCLKTCNPKESPYCIAKALINAQQGNFEEGFVFAGSNAYKATEKNCKDKNGNFITVKRLMETLSEEYHSA
jgi:NAD(P)H-dependent flavin oxidoreductase YrpB (nitropropane dioxygenase family)